MYVPARHVFCGCKNPVEPGCAPIAALIDELAKLETSVGNCSVGLVSKGIPFTKNWTVPELAADALLINARRFHWFSGIDWFLSHWMFVPLFPNSATYCNVPSGLTFI